MQITVLGSGTNVPSIDRAGASYYIKSGRDSLLLDFGTGSLRNLLKAGIDKLTVNDIIFSHLHLDHLTDLLPFMFNRFYRVNIEKKSIPLLRLYGPKGFSRFITQIFSKFRGLPIVLARTKTKDLWKSSLKICNFNIKTLPVKHGDMPTIGVRLERNGKTFAYSGDTEPCDNLAKLIEGVDLAVLECASTKQVNKNGHLNSAQAGKIAQEADVKKIILSHLYMSKKARVLKKEVAENFSGKIIVARDLMKIKV